MTKKAESFRSPLTDYPNPARIQQMLTGLELGPADPAVLDYLSHFMDYIPVGCAYFLHVMPEIPMFSSAMQEKQSDLLDRNAVSHGIMETMRRRVAESGIDQQTIQVQYDILEGDPLAAMLTEAEDIQADLLVIGQQTDKAEHGIWAKNLVRQVRSHALIVPDRARWKMDRILVPVDFSAHSVAALRAAFALRKQLEIPPEVIALNVYELPNLSVYKVQRTREELREMLQEDRQMAFSAFLQEYLPADADQVKTEFLEKEVPGIAHYILDYAREQEVDFIVMGARGHSAVERLFLGSVTEKMLSQNDRIPTLVIKGETS